MVLGTVVWVTDYHACDLLKLFRGGDGNSSSSWLLWAIRINPITQVNEQQQKFLAMVST